MSGFGGVWFAWALVQIAMATYALVALARWRGARFTPAAGERLGVGPVLLPAAAAVAAALLIARVDDVEFARWLGTGALAVAAVASIAALLRRSARG